jgi:hypothetical protein
MRGLDAVDILDLAAPRSGPSARALAILSHAEPDAAPGELPLGVRDARLMAVRAMNFGPEVDLVSDCPHCAATLQLTLAAADVGLDVKPPTPAPVTLALAGRRVRLRAVSASDLAAAEGQADVAAARRVILERCVLSVDDQPGPPPPQGLADAIEAALESMDPAAEAILDLACPDCGATWSETFDAAQILAADVQRAAGRLMAEVAALARVYHWSERDIVALPPARRRFYLEAIG